VLKAVDDGPVWSVSCLFVAKSHRKQGLSVALLKAAARFVAERGGRVVEGYPVEPRAGELPAAFAWTGLASAFRRAGYREHRRGSPTRPIMRLVVARAPRRVGARTISPPVAADPARISAAEKRSEGGPFLVE
jgi:GNAT superfamily N-acetyltransferase